MTGVPKQTAPNIIVFGETGAGKSSVVNMLQGDRHARVSSSAKGVTFQNDHYSKEIQDRRYSIFDTVGLAEGNTGTVSASDAIEGLYRLMRGLEGGVSLLVYVVQGPRLKISTRRNYEMFYEIFCEKRVPIVVVITRLENEDNMDAWWDTNKEAFEEQKMMFDDAACITATKGKRNAYLEEYEESQKKLEKLISHNCRKTPWLPPAGMKTSKFIAVVVKMLNRFAKIFALKSIVLARAVYQALVAAGMEEEEARASAVNIQEKVDGV